jgi:hypothetical protein
MDASLTHGIENGAPRWPDEMPELERLGREHFAATKDTIARRGIEANLEQTGELAFATAPYQADYIPEMVETAQSFGWTAEALDAQEARAQVDSPAYGLRQLTVARTRLAQVRMTKTAEIQVTVAAPVDVVWEALRDLSAIRRWYGWEYDGLAEEIDAIFLENASASDDDHTVELCRARWGGLGRHLRGLGDLHTATALRPRSPPR